jgi:hypothetical protein
MTSKAEIVERLGDAAVLLPTLISDALAANDCVKIRLSVLQEAAQQATSPGRSPRSYEGELRAAGLEPAGMLNLIAGAQSLGPGRLRLPSLDNLLAGIRSELGRMAAPLATAGDPADAALVARVDSVIGAMPSAEDEQIELGMIEAMTGPGREGGDSVHRLVMDLHKAINRLAAATAVESLDGARVHGLEDGDRMLVKAFMRGLNRTQPLAFGHPGLGTTAVRAGGRLTIQNDIGTTDAHVLVVHVEADEVRLTYTDVHRPRAKFFISLFEGQDAEWSPLAERPGDGLENDVFYLLTGRYCAREAAGRERFLDFLGSRIVFLIDWNKARKALQSFLGKNAAIKLLTWAAGHDYGHRAFLELGGMDLVFEAVQRVAAGRIPYGVRLDTALGEEDCLEFLESVLRDTSQGLAAGRTVRLIRDEIQADLARRFETAESAVLTVLIRHLGLTRLLAGTIADLLSAVGVPSGEDRRAFARRAKRLEEKADRLTVSAREIAQRIRESRNLRLVIDAVENATDSLEDCAFLLSLLPEDGTARLGTAPLAQLSEIVTDSVGHMVRAVEAASRLPNGKRVDAADSLQSIDATVLAERKADAAEREAFAAFMDAPASDVKALMLALEIGRTLESATDHMAHAALSLRDRVLEELSA